MTYTNWETQILPAVALLKWYRLKDVIDYLHDLRDTVILHAHYETNMTHDLQTVDKQPLYCNLPASAIQRFPENDVYLCEGTGSWHLMLDILDLLVVRLHNRDIEDNLRNGNEHAFTSVMDVEISLLKVINQLLQLIEERVDLVTRSRFESRYNLIWSGTEAHDVITCDNIFCKTYKAFVCNATAIVQCYQTHLQHLKSNKFT